VILFPFWIIWAIKDIIDWFERRASEKTVNELIAYRKKNNISFPTHEEILKMKD
jgi:hypothetical protein